MLKSQEPDAQFPPVKHIQLVLWIYLNLLVERPCIVSMVHPPYPTKKHNQRDDKNSKMKTIAKNICFHFHKHASWKEQQLTSFRVQKTRYGRKTFLLLPSGSLDTSEVSSPRRALIPANATNEMRNHQVSSLKESTYPCQRNQ